jgi:hypothetical protein
MKIIFIYIGAALTGIGFAVLSILRSIRAKRDGRGSFSSLPIKVTDTDRKMFKIGVFLVCLGLLIFLIIEVTVGLKIR